MPDSTLPDPSFFSFAFLLYAIATPSCLTSQRHSFVLCTVPMYLLKLSTGVYLTIPLAHGEVNRRSDMSLRSFALVWLAAACVTAAPASSELGTGGKPLESASSDTKEDLTAAASNAYTRGYSSWVGYDYPNNYVGGGVTGYGTLDDRYNNYYGQGVSGYDSGYGTGFGNGYGNGYGAGYSGGQGNGYSYGGYNSGSGYGSRGYSGQNGYGGYGGNGGYGGYGGNGGLTSYYGYNNPNNYYSSGNHLGYGYYNKGLRSGYYNGITPSVVTGYRGYSRR
ncbi:hypothetical protein EVAR_7628_1 [Eumeta japonica]|uniref:Uncharacterized protein n=1 Tax=Eumeta variegata TaxID=151549 RepID=A0A4C1TLD7_EUMVA|nr:hypothetical protein EVAR_7628_1 [Eumeta japonica]